MHMACPLSAQVAVRLNADESVVHRLIGAPLSSTVSAPASDLHDPLLGKNGNRSDAKITHNPFWRYWLPKLPPGKRLAREAKQEIFNIRDLWQFLQDPIYLRFRAFCMNSPQDLAEIETCTRMTQFARANHWLGPFMAILLVDCEAVSFESLAAFCRRAGVDIRRVVFTQLVCVAAPLPTNNGTERVDAARPSLV
jgi:hypothetical protein